MHLVLSLIFALYISFEAVGAAEIWPQGDEVIDLTGNVLEKNIDGGELTDIQVPAQIISKRSRVRLCGRQLLNAIRMACMMEKSRGKRSVGDWSHDSWPTTIHDQDEEEHRGLGYALSPSYGRFKAVSFFQGLNKRGGAAENCCAKPCTLAHLATYC